MELMTSHTHVQNAAPSSCVASTAAPCVAPDRVLDVGPTGYSALVYNLTVDLDHEYFANGILVSNCDAGLYSFRRYISRKTEEPSPPPKQGTPEWFAAEEKRMREGALQATRERIAEERGEYGDGWD